VEVLTAREVPLGGLRALTVRRTLPHRDRSFIGAWCFADHYGPADHRMDVAPHPHTGLQTVSWLFAGEIEHRDTGGVHASVRPGEVNLMTGGLGIAHSEVSQGEGLLHGVQLWVALPEAHREAPRGFAHHATTPVPIPGGVARVFLGELRGVDASPVETFTPLLGAQLDLDPDATITLALDPSFEHGVLLDTGAVRVEDTALGHGDLACLDAGPESLRLTAGPDGARVVLLGGPPFEEDIVMWWNFVGRTHEDVVAAREAWEAGAERFGTVQGYVGATARIPAPPLPGVRLRSRGRRG